MFINVEGLEWIRVINGGEMIPYNTIVVNQKLFNKIRNNTIKDNPKFEENGEKENEQ